MTTTTHTTITVTTHAGPVPVPGLPTACPGVVIVPVLDTDDEYGDVIYTGLWSLRHAATGKQIVDERGTARDSVNDAYMLAEQLAALGQDWTRLDAPAAWPAGVGEQVKALFLAFPKSVPARTP